MTININLSGRSAHPGQELARSPEKRDLLCDVVYSFVQEDHLLQSHAPLFESKVQAHTSQDTLNHILTLRALKEKAGTTSSF